MGKMDWLDDMLKKHEEEDFVEKGLRGLKESHKGECIRSVPMTDKVYKAAVEAERQMKEKKKKFIELALELARCRFEVEKAKSKVWSLVDVDMDLSSDEFNMNWNTETKEIEIIGETMKEIEKISKDALAE